MLCHTCFRKDLSALNALERQAASAHCAMADTSPWAVCSASEEAAETQQSFAAPPTLQKGCVALCILETAPVIGCVWVVVVCIGGACRRGRACVDARTRCERRAAGSLGVRKTMQRGVRRRGREGTQGTQVVSGVSSGGGKRGDRRRDQLERDA
jgi:hypothetical protein